MRGVTIVTQNGKGGDKFQQWFSRRAVCRAGLKWTIKWMHLAYRTDCLVSVYRGAPPISVVAPDEDTVLVFGDE